ncbi:MAG: hypothetical protein Q9172_007502 [Xanthocarpia lactea]
MPGLSAELSLNVQETVGYASVQEQEASRYQVAWTNAMAEGRYQTPSQYDKVEVLLLYWLDSDMGTTKEVDDLESVFVNKFGYHATRAPLNGNSKKKLQVKVNAKVANFVEEHDGPNTLLIVYYAGHGSPGELFGNLELKGLFEYLAACQANGTTSVPGPKSFTRALIYALTALAREKNKGRFTTDELLRKIKTDAPDFPNDQTPVMSDREHNKSSAGRIMLHPIRQNKPVDRTTSEVCDISEARGYAMTLHLQFGEKPPVRNVVTLGKRLNEIFEHSTLEVHRIRWGGIRETAFTRATQRFTKTLRERRASSVSQRPTIVRVTAPTSECLVLDTNLLSPYAASPDTQDSTGDESSERFTASSPVTPPEAELKTGSKEEIALSGTAQVKVWEGNLHARLEEEQRPKGNPAENS